ncbi:hypothetical protein Ddye_022080 [Dipteronia dyeriana]|uniref:PGG domain-containing protein n=1 Tax=Dipteronia dyeriana TaxID=168575 RepID=A0AAD9U3V4_9ROSI|nr:hypothetical protein Ddye_022080 [Dipteronia dyeriana]
MEPEDLTLQERIGNTAFFIAAATGSIRIAEVMLHKNTELLGLRGSSGMTPLQEAVLLASKEMATIFYDKSIPFLTREDLVDIGLDLLQEYLDLAVTRENDHRDGETALHVLARKPPSVFNGNEDQYSCKCNPLYLAALKGDWENARGLIESDPLMVRTAITEGYETALHVATKAEQTGFALRIMEHMDEQDLALQDLKGETAFCLAVATSNIRLASVMQSKNPDLATLRGSWNMTPLYLAVLLGMEGMATFLLQYTVGLTPEERVRIFFQSIKTDLYVVARRLLIEANELAVTRDMDGDTALHMLARKPPFIFAEEGSMALCFVQYLWSKVTKQQNVKELIRHPSNLLFDAARMGNFPLLAEWIRCIFNLIHELGYVRELIASYVDAEKNTLLHLAAKNPNQSPASSTALEMQQELLLFKEVEKIILVSLREAKNAKDLTARELFTIEHSNLVKSGSEWLRNSAGSCMLVATLIATVVFAAALTVPGGNDGKTGMPLLEKNFWFHVFAISDAIAMSSSSFSILIILSILTSRYRETDFVISGTIKMIIAHLSLFISLAAMSIAFGLTFFLVYHDRSNIIPVFTLKVVTLPITVFVLLQYPLLKDMFYLIYYSSSLR